MKNTQSNTPITLPIEKPSGEQFVVADEYVKKVQDLRWALSVEESRQDFEQATEAMLKVPKTNALLSEGAWTDSLNASPKDLLELESYGVPEEGILQFLNEKNSGEEIVLPFGYSQAARVQRVSNGITTRVTDAEQAQNMQLAFEQRLVNSPVYLAVHSAVDPDAETVNLELNLAEDPVVGAYILSRLDMLDGARYVRSRRLGTDPGEALVTGLMGYAGQEQESSADEIKVSSTWGSTQIHVALDKTGHCRVQIAQAPSFAYKETANQSREKAVPFVETSYMRELADALTSQGLVLSDALRDFVTSPGEADRYGGPYTHMSREIAKWINNPTRLRVSDLFTPEDTELSDAEKEQVARHALESMQTDADSPIGLLLGLAKQSIQKTNTNSDIPVTESEVAMRDGSCFDLPYYYHDAAKRFELTEVKEPTAMLYDGASNTYLTQNKVQFNGVNLPKGSLMKKGSDGNWAFLRLTPFCFDEEYKQDVFGTEIIKGLQRVRLTLGRYGLQ